MLSEVSLDAGNEILFDERSTVLFKERVSKEEENGNKDSNEEELKIEGLKESFKIG